MARARPAERPRAGSGRLATAVVLLLLIVAGFAVGMLAGLAWKEPGLLLAHLAGETERVEWNAPAEDEQAAEAALADERPADPQVRRQAARAATAETPPVAAAPVERFLIQVGAFQTSRPAERLATSLRRKGFPVVVSPEAKAGEARWRVRVGPLTTREEAERTAARLKKVEKLPTWIVSEDAT